VIVASFLVSFLVSVLADRPLFTGMLNN
jgi:hypothetical protein